MRIVSCFGLMTLVCALGLVACGDDDSGDSSGTGGSSGSGGSGGGSTGGSAGTGTGGAAGSGTGGAAGSGTGGSGTGGSGTGGSGGLTAGPGQFNYKGEVNGQSISGNCTLKKNADIDSYVVGIAGSQLNVGCPGVTGTAVSNPSALLVLKGFAGLPASFSFTKGMSTAFEVTGWTSATKPRLSGAHKNVDSIDVKGTYDAATKHVTATVKGKWGTPTQPLYEAEGWLEIAFDVTHP